MKTRLTRDPETGLEYFIDIETGERLYDEQDGSGIFSSMANVAKKVASKLTGKAAKEIAKKAVSKAAEKGAEKVGEKTGQLIGEKIYDKFKNKDKVVEVKPKIGKDDKEVIKKTLTDAMKGDQIVKLLKAESSPKPVSTQSPLSAEFDNLINM